MILKLHTKERLNGDSETNGRLFCFTELQAPELSTTHIPESTIHTEGILNKGNEKIQVSLVERWKTL